MSKPEVKLLMRSEKNVLEWLKFGQRVMNHRRVLEHLRSITDAEQIILRLYDDHSGFQEAGCCFS